MVLAARRSPLTDRVDAAVFPETQGGPLMHVVAAKAVAFQEALAPEFAVYQRQVLGNARALAASLLDRGYDIVTGGTDNHMLLVDLRRGGIDAGTAERDLHAAHIAVNRVSLPGDTGSEPTQGTGGLRLGTPAVTTRGLTEIEIRAVAGWIADVLEAKSSAASIARVRTQVLDLCARFPVYAQP
jgi:glycine hydroxymethyltransferase